MFNKVLIANRGEIALRVIRACKELGIRTVAVFSEPDRESVHVAMADEAFCVGPAAATHSYLSIPNIISAALVSGAEAIHPGYGFLAENSNFAEICTSHKLKFIGPTPQAMDMMGNKSRARSVMSQAGVPIMPGTGDIESDEDAIAFARQAGFPVMIKATAGGGGKGMRVVHDAASLLKALGTARAEAHAAFGDDHVYLEKFLPEARHIEIQVLADEHGNVLHLGERDCSVQRRNQKLIEEAPSGVVDEPLRAAMAEAALRGARAAGYTSAGTIEFLLDQRDNSFYFLEMNTRIQVEHPVTEMVTGIDLVKAQIRVAAGEPLGIGQEDIRLKGHAVECRINAEDAERGFAPSTGRIEHLHLPGGPGVRMDTHIGPGYKVLPFYDSLLGKVICHGADREEALARMNRALEEFRAEGVLTTAPFLRTIINNAFFRKNKIHTTFVENLSATPALAAIH
ncbi:MAG: acetyl-CoA carboxylase biotin carboxylase subunit [Armatimonadetes bacterium]|nr:acetyl-CoA carboxylase biotin carboxylase subunit [Armatimonadota bacterium]